MTNDEYLKQIDDVIKKGKYKDDWDFMKNIPVPEWYKDAKFGIFIHWGVYSVPAFGSEWYPRNMYIQGSKEYEHHIKTYGAHKDFGYKDFIPMFKAENFNPDEWMDLISKSGAKYVMPVAEHHDGFQMYKSAISSYNSHDMGPRRDIMGELKKSAENKGIIFCASSHRFEHWFFMGHGRKFDSDVKDPLCRGDLYWPAMEEPQDHDDIYAAVPTEEFMEDWLIRCCELVDNYRPAVLYFDWWILIDALKPYLKKFAAYYYNRGLEWGTPVAINYKYDSFAFGSAVLDIERGLSSSIRPHFWQCCTSVARNTWGHTASMDYKTSAELIRDLTDIVSKNGCMLLNIGPKADGTIPEGDKKILLEIGKWLETNGEAIYNTRCFRTYGEGETEITEGHFTDKKEREFTSGDIRFTMNGSSLYAFVMKYPENGEVKIKSLAFKSPNFNSSITDIDILGFDEKPEFKRTAEALFIRTKNVKSDTPVTFKITLG